METRMENNYLESDAPPLYGIRWAAVLAGLAVGLGVHLLFLLIGAAAGFAVYGTGARPDGNNISLVAALWNSVSLLIAAAIGGYVAARTSGLRRTADGVLHAVASWGASMLCYTLLTMSVAGSTLTGAFGMAAASAGFAVPQTSEFSMNTLLNHLERGERAASVQVLRERFGLTPEQANSVADRAISMFGATGGRSGEQNINDIAQAASATGAWLSLVIVLSLAAGAAGGLVGSRASLKRSRPGHYREPRTARSHTPDHGLPNAS